MELQQLIAEKKSLAQSVAPEDVIDCVAKFLREKKIVRVVVCWLGGGIVGVLSECDIVRGLAKKGVAIINVRVADFTTKNFLFAALGDDTSAVMRKLWINNVWHMPVARDGEWVGIFSVCDLMKFLHRIGCVARKHYYPSA